MLHGNILELRNLSPNKREKLNALSERDEGAEAVTLFQ
jgi:hypothetical protein